MNVNYDLRHMWNEYLCAIAHHGFIANWSVSKVVHYDLVCIRVYDKREHGFYDHTGTWLGGTKI